jgi:hypothetical protein
MINGAIDRRVGDDFSARDLDDICRLNTLGAEITVPDLFLKKKCLT